MMNSRYLICLVAIVTLALLGACNAVASPTPTPSVVEAAEAEVQAEEQTELLSTAWTLKSLGDEDPVDVVPGSYPSVNYMESRYSGYTGCNFYVGVYGVEGATLRMNTPAMTQGPCADNMLTTQQDYFMSLLDNTTTYEIQDDNLLLYSVDTLVMTLEPLPEVPFDGTTWDFQFISTGEGVWKPAIPGTTANVVFEGDTVSGNAGCNTFTGTFTRDANSITIGPLATTMMMCSEPEGVMEQEQAILEQLSSAAFITVYPRTFELFSAEKEPLMLFAASAE